MNTPATPGTRAGTPERPPSCRARNEPREPRREAVDFDRALKDVAARREPNDAEGSCRDGSDRGSEPTVPEATPGGCAWTVWLLPPSAPQPGAAGARGVVESKGATQAALQSRLSTDVATLPTLGAVPTTSHWELSLGSPFGGSLQVRATREADPGARPGWSLTLGARGGDGLSLTRHLPRLNERLRAHDAGATHARIEERPHDGDAEPSA